MLPKQNELPIVKEIQKPVKKQAEKLASVRHIPGLKLFSLNLSDGKIQEEEFKTVATMHGKIRNEVNFKENHIYLQALNYANAKRKFVNKLKKSF